jgi:hypothetical protein
MKTVVSVFMLALAPTVAFAANSDPGAGNWQMIVLSSPTQFSVPPPLSTTSFAYQSELADIRNAQAGITTAQQQAIDYWKQGPVLGWNKLLLEFVARADLPPAPRPDGTYPVPDPNNPFADPQYPFGNPPYASRAYSYVTAAQYDALKAGWYYKYLFMRPSPAKVDTTIKALMPVSDLPAYPSEDAVVAGVSVELLKLLFPTMVDQITQKAAEAQMAANLSGKSSASDLAAGLALGQAIAQVFITRARGDGMSAAGSAAGIPALTAAVQAKGEVAWHSMEIPPRPPMLPLFGKVKAWMMTPDNVLNERPGAPPSTSSTQMQRELAEVKSALSNLTRKQIAIVYNWADGVSTATPSGHWNYIAWPYLQQSGFSEVRVARTLALMNMAMHDAAVVCWDTKYAYFNPRPSQLDSGIRTVIGLPNFPSYISGHSTYSAAAADVLSYIFPAGAATFDALKEEAAISRLYGGIHYRSDIEVGKVVGKRVGDYTVGFALHDGADQ